MLNLHIGGAVSVFFICASLLAGDFWFNDREMNNLKISETQINPRESSAEFVLSTPIQFFFIHQPGVEFDGNVSEAKTLRVNSWVEANVHAGEQFVSTPGFLPDANAVNAKKK